MTTTRANSSLRLFANHYYCRAIDAGSEWRTFGSERCGGEASRVGGPENPLLCGSDLGTTIAGSYDGDSIHNRKKSRGSLGVDNVDRILLRAFSEISSMGERLGLSKTVTDRANHMFKVQSTALHTKVLTMLVTVEQVNNFFFRK